MGLGATRRGACVLSPPWRRSTARLLWTSTDELVPAARGRKPQLGSTSACAGGSSFGGSTTRVIRITTTAHPHVRPLATTDRTDRGHVLGATCSLPSFRRGRSPGARERNLSHVRPGGACALSELSSPEALARTTPRLGRRPLLRSCIRGRQASLIVEASVDRHEIRPVDLAVRRRQIITHLAPRADLRHDPRRGPSELADPCRLPKRERKQFLAVMSAVLDPDAERAPTTRTYEPVCALPLTSFG